MISRKSTLITLFTLVFALPLVAQIDGKYRLSISFDRIYNSGNTLKTTDYRVSSFSSAGTEVLRSWSTGGIKEKRYLDAPDPIVVTFANSENKRPQKLLFWGQRRWSNGFLKDGTRDSNNELSLDVSQPYLYVIASKGDNRDDFFPSLQTTLTIELIPVFINLHYYTDKGEGAESFLNLLPDNDLITLKATKGYVEATYKWQYQVAGESQWLDLPNSVSYREGKSVVTFKGTDLFERNKFNELISQKKTILFRINAITDEKRNEQDYVKLALTPTYSAPHILSHEITQEQCHQSGDASVRIFLDRPLWPNEALAIFQVGGAGSNVDGLDEANSFSVNHLAAGTYTFQLRGTHSNGLDTYRETDKHQFSTTIAERPAISHSFTQKDISCFAGQDGEIVVTATGGTGIFTASLIDGEGTVVQQQNIQTGTSTFKRLRAGRYTLRVQDSNGCIAKNNAGAEVIHQITLSEPAEAVSIREVGKTSPLAYQSSDGVLQIAVSGGSPTASGYQVRFVRTSDNLTLAPTETRADEGQFLYTLRGIPRGQYTAIAEDARFSTLDSEDKQEPCGCFAQFPITLTAPPPLSVSIEETHFVSCHGDSDGELSAHGKGGKPITTAQLPYAYTWYKISEGAKETLSLQTDSIARNLVAGQYQVKITDANGISVESAIFTLMQPDLLALSFATRPPSCSGGEGLITTTVTGGTSPYSYEWNKEGATDANLTIHETGSFYVRVVDSRGCSITGNVEVIAPDAITIVPTLVNPTCNNANNGSIALELSGGTAPYTVQWKDDNTLTALHRNQLKAGEYVALISDKSGYSIQYRAVLQQPEPLSVTLSDGFTLCNEQSRKITATPSEEGVTFQWFHEDNPLSETSKDLLVSKAGRYQVMVTNPNGCTATAEVQIKTSTVHLPLDITVPTSVTAGASIHAVNISQTHADRLEWILPANAIITNNTDERVIFSVPVPGIYEITLIGYLEDCSTLITQRLEVQGEGNITLPDGKEDVIQQFLVSPNPTTGEFKVYVELKEPRDFTLRLLSPTSVEMDRKNVLQTQKQTFEYELRGNTEGVFGIELKVGEQKSVLKVTKKRN